jgi:hypothetical protein
VFAFFFYMVCAILALFVVPLAVFLSLRDRVKAIKLIVYAATWALPLSSIIVVAVAWGELRVHQLVGDVIWLVAVVAFCALGFSLGARLAVR